MLKTRREQAEVESSTLDLISSVTAKQHSTTASIGGNVARCSRRSRRSRRGTDPPVHDARRRSPRRATDTGLEPPGYPENLSRPSGCPAAPDAKETPQAKRSWPVNATRQPTPHVPERREWALPSGPKEPAGQNEVTAYRSRSKFIGGHASAGLMLEFTLPRARRAMPALPDTLKRELQRIPCIRVTMKTSVNGLSRPHRRGASIPCPRAPSCQIASVWSSCS